MVPNIKSATNPMTPIAAMSAICVRNFNFDRKLFKARPYSQLLMCRRFKSKG